MSILRTCFYIFRCDLGGVRFRIEEFWGESTSYATNVGGGRALRVKNWGGSAFSGRRPENWHRPPLGMFLGPSLISQAILFEIINSEFIILRQPNDKK